MRGASGRSAPGVRLMPSESVEGRARCLAAGAGRLLGFTSVAGCGRLLAYIGGLLTARRRGRGKSVQIGRRNFMVLLPFWGERNAN